MVLDNNSAGRGMVLAVESLVAFSEVASAQLELLNAGGEPRFSSSMFCPWDD